MRRQRFHRIHMVSAVGIERSRLILVLLKIEVGYLLILIRTEVILLMEYDRNNLKLVDKME